jgi:hypothetical protein
MTTATSSLPAPIARGADGGDERPGGSIHCIKHEIRCMLQRIA